MCGFEGELNGLDHSLEGMNKFLILWMEDMKAKCVSEFLSECDCGEVHPMTLRMR